MQKIQEKPTGPSSYQLQTRIRREGRSPKPTEGAQKKLPEFSGHLLEFVSLQKLVVYISLIVILIFIGGYVSTLIGVELIGYKKLPLLGAIQVDSAGNQYFVASYPDFRQYAINNDPNKAGTETEFSRAGTLGTGLFFYSILNALHWIIEFKFSNLGGIVLIPILSLLIGCFLLFFRFLPYSVQTRENALLIGILVGITHAAFLSSILLIASILSPPLRTLFYSPHFFVLEMIRKIIPGIFLIPSLILIVFTGLTYGAIVSGILAAMVNIRNTLLSTRS